MDQQIWSWSEDLALLSASVLLAGLLQYVVLRRALGGGNGGRVGAMLVPLVAVAIHAGLWLAVGIAYILLLVPGLYLSGRMSAAIGLAVVEHAGLLGSIAGSWHRTRRSVWSLMIVHALLLFPLIALTAAITVAWYAEYGTEHLEEASIEFAFITNLLFGVMTMAGWAIAGAVYRLTAPDRHGIDEIFA